MLRFSEVGKLQYSSQPLHSEVLSKTNKINREVKREPQAAPPPSTAIAGCSIQPSSCWLQQAQDTTLMVFSFCRKHQKSLPGHSVGKKTPILIADGKGPSWSAGLLMLTQPPEQQLLPRSREATNQSTDVLFLPHFLCTLGTTFISIWATCREIVNTAVITLPLFPFLNNANFKGFCLQAAFTLKRPAQHLLNLPQGKLEPLTWRLPHSSWAQREILL